MIIQQKYDNHDHILTTQNKSQVSVSEDQLVPLVQAAKSLSIKVTSPFTACVCAGKYFFQNDKCDRYSEYFDQHPLVAGFARRASAAATPLPQATDQLSNRGADC